MFYNDERLLRLHGLLSTCKSVNSYFFGIFQDDDDLVDKTEGRVIEAFLCLVVKLSEVSFRPMFLRVRVHNYVVFDLLCNDMFKHQGLPSKTDRAGLLMLYCLAPK